MRQQCLEVLFVLSLDTASKNRPIFHICQYFSGSGSGLEFELSGLGCFNYGASIREDGNIFSSLWVCQTFIFLVLKWSNSECQVGASLSCAPGGLGMQRPRVGAPLLRLLLLLFARESKQRGNNKKKEGKHRCRNGIEYLTPHLFGQHDTQAE